MEFGPGPALAGMEPEEIVFEIEQAWYRLGRTYTASPDYEILDLVGYTRLRSLKKGSKVNHVFNINLAAAELDKTLTALRAQHRPPNPALKWWLAPGSRPTWLENRLLQSGGKISMVMSAMALDLTTWPINTPLKAGYQMPQRVEERGLIGNGLVLFGRVLGSDERTAQDRAELFQGLECRPGGEFSHFVITGEKDDRVKATTTIQYAGDVVAVLFVASDEALRGRGLAKACMAAALSEAASRGAKLAVLQATELGRPLYHRLGFHDYGRLATIETNH